jgi:aryl-alcohol dehydrogenase-like predicted oxidoreductase
MIIGEFHKCHPEQKFDVITKIPSSLSSIRITEKVESYIRQLQVTHIDTLMFHSFGIYEEKKNEMEEILFLKNKGLINKFGVSVYTNQEIKIVIEDKNVDVIQFPFNIFDNTLKRGEIIKQAKIMGKIIHVRSAFLQGLFFKDRHSDDKVVRKLREPLLELDRISEQSGKSIAEIALNYCIQQPLIDNVLIGIESLEQLKENLKISEKRIDNGLMFDLDNIDVIDVDMLNPALW